MNFCILISDGYVTGIASSKNPLPNPVTEQVKNEVFSILCNKPVPEEGYEYRLLASTLKWELVELPPDPEPGVDATEEDYKNALEQMGVNFNEEDYKNALEQMGVNFNEDQ